MKNLINIKSKTGLSGFYIVYKGSTILEDEKTYGLSHLMEHLVCKNFEHLIEKLQEDGVSWNACTSEEYIMFYMTGLDEYINKWKYVIFDLLKDFKITQKQLDSEKKIVLEEYKDSFNTQRESHSENLFRKLFNLYSAIGERSCIENVTLNDCENFFDKQFNPSLIINISKNNKLDKSLLEKYKFVDRKFDFKFKYLENNIPKYEFLNEYNEKSSVINLSKIIDKDGAYVRFICSMLGMGLKSPLYQEIREKKGLCYYVHSCVRETNGSGMAIISTETSKDKVDILQDTITEVLSNKGKYLTKERFESVKKCFEIQLKKEEILNYQSISKFMCPSSWSTEKLLKDKNFSFEKIYDDVYDKYFDFNTWYKSCDKTEFEK